MITNKAILEQARHSVRRRFVVSVVGTACIAGAATAAAAFGVPDGPSASSVNSVIGTFSAWHAELSKAVRRPVKIASADADRAPLKTSPVPAAVAPAVASNPPAPVTPSAQPARPAVVAAAPIFNIASVSAASAASATPAMAKKVSFSWVWESEEHRDAFASAASPDVAKSLEMSKSWDKAAPAEMPAPVEAVKPIDAPAPIETAKPMEAPAPAEAANPVEAPRLIEHPVESPKPAVTPVPVETAQPVKMSGPVLALIATEMEHPLDKPVPMEPLQPAVTMHPAELPNTAEVGKIVVLPMPLPRPPPTPAQQLSLEGKEREKAEQCLARAIYFEARNEPVRGQIAVAQVVLNRVFSPYYPKDVCSVVYQNAHRHLACQFTFACDGIRDVIRERGAWARAHRIAKQTLDARYWLPEVAKSTHYHATYVRPRWAREMKKMAKHGVHMFYRPHRWGDGSNEPGWGLASAGSQPASPPVKKTN